MIRASLCTTLRGIGCQKGRHRSHVKRRGPASAPTRGERTGADSRLAAAAILLPISTILELLVVIVSIFLPPDVHALLAVLLLVADPLRGRRARGARGACRGRARGGLGRARHGGLSRFWRGVGGCSWLSNVLVLARTRARRSTRSRCRRAARSAVERLCALEVMCRRIWTGSEEQAGLHEVRRDGRGGNRLAPHLKLLPLSSLAVARNAGAARTCAALLHAYSCPSRDKAPVHTVRDRPAPARHPHLSPRVRRRGGRQTSC